MHKIRSPHQGIPASVDEMGVPSVILERPLIVSAACEDSKQGDSENLADLRSMSCENNEQHKGSREVINSDRSAVW